MRLTNSIIREAKSRPIDEVTPEEISSFIQNKCSQYLKIIDGTFPFYRGISSTTTKGNDLGIAEVRKDRRSRGMSDEAAKTINKMLHKNGHARRDRSVICTGDFNHARGFGGNTCLVFPLNPIKRYTWVETIDMNMSDSRSGWELDTPEVWAEQQLGEPKFFNYGYEEDDEVRDILSRLRKPFEDHFHTNKDAVKAHKAGYEIWFDCKEFLFLDALIFEWDVHSQEVIPGKRFKEYWHDVERERGNLENAYDARELYRMFKV